LPGYNKKIHRVPDSHSEAAANFARRLLSSEISGELQSIVESARQILKLKYRDVKKDDDESGSGTIDTDAFRFSVEVDQSNDDHTDAVIRRQVRLREPYAKLPEEFDGIFPEEVDCMTFMIAVAARLTPKGIVVPTRGATELPMDYMRRFIGAN